MNHSKIVLTNRSEESWSEGTVHTKEEAKSIVVPSSG